jgi:hypothetical protein
MLSGLSRSSSRVRQRRATIEIAWAKSCRSREVSLFIEIRILLDPGVRISVKKDVENDQLGRAAIRPPVIEA